jgi:aminoglycoside 3-N-acetyltransferase
VIATSTIERRFPLARKTLRVVRQICNPIGPDRLRRALDQLTLKPADVLLVHTSLSACGRFTAGPESVLSTLRNYGRTTCFPTFSFCYPEPPASEVDGPLFDPAKTPSKMGLLTEIFRHAPDATRSIHATHALAAAGPLARELCADHYLQDAPCGGDSPFGRLIRQRAAVLLFGVSFDSYTFYHTAEDASGSSFAYTPDLIDRLRVVDEEGQPRTCLSRRQTRDPRRFGAAGDLLERAGLARRVELGRGFLRYVPDSAKAHDFLVARLRRTPDFLFQTCNVPLR